MDETNEKLMKYLREIESLKHQFNLSATDLLMLRITAINEVQRMSYEDVKKYILARSTPIR